ncbi:hypothetical protein [Geodermatophilus telluris]|uniref:hypothetical protein n=1 Tax=Geodermatophilus telluris TaxID=1190417 RepID=UPI000B8774AB|nr:hypothetical protein [Geodermatophilus telluris]
MFPRMHRERMRRRGERLLAAAERGRNAVAAEEQARRAAGSVVGFTQLQLTEQQQSRAAFTELVAAGQELLTSLESLLAPDAEPFWTALANDETALSALPWDRRLRLQESADHDVFAVLPLLGYRPPPDLEEIAPELRTAVDGVLNEGTPAGLRAPRARRARRELTFFVRQLRRTLTEAAEHGPKPEEVSRRVRVTAWVRQAILVAGPAALAVLAAAFAEAPTDLGAAGGEAGVETVKQAVELGSAVVLTRVLGAGGPPPPAATLEDLTDDVDDRMADVHAVANLPPGDDAREEAVFLALRTLYRALQQQAREGQTGPRGRHARLWAEVRELLRGDDLQLAVGVWEDGRKSPRRRGGPGRRRPRNARSGQ